MNQHEPNLIACAARLAIVAKSKAVTRQGCTHFNITSFRWLRSPSCGGALILVFLSELPPYLARALFFLATGVTGTLGGRPIAINGTHPPGRLLLGGHRTFPATARLRNARKGLVKTIDMPPMSPTLDEISRLDVQAILSATKGCLKVPSHVRRLKDGLTRFLIDNMSPELSANLGALLAARDNGQTGSSSGQKRRRQEVDPPPRKVARDTEDDKGCKANEFLELPSDEVVRSCYRQFYEATSNSALNIAVCAVCGRERDYLPDNVVSFNLQDIPSPSRLFPSSPHVQQTLFNGMLLEPQGVSTVRGQTIVNICGECLAELRKDSPLPPRFSLANGLWIGPIPIELSSLTFPEQLLIAHLYPRVYVFKLYPKSGGGAAAELQRGMRGNVSTYELNVSAAAEMVEGVLMPRRPSVLASLIAITYIGMGPLPQKWLQSMFRVRRFHVARALEWLRTYNPIYYGDITISPARLSDLPEDSVPDEILSVVRHSTDVGLVDQENGGYVRTEEAGK